MLASIDLFIEPEPYPSDKLKEKLNRVSADYNSLFEEHKKIHGEMFNRFSFNLGKDSKLNVTSEELLASSSFENFNQDLLKPTLSTIVENPSPVNTRLPSTLQPDWDNSLVAGSYNKFSPTFSSTCSEPAWI